MSIVEKLKVVLLAAFHQIPPELASTRCDGLDGGQSYYTHRCWYDSIGCCELLESRFCVSHCHHTSVVMPLDCQVGVHSDSQAPAPCFDIPDEAIPNSYFRCRLRMQRRLVASSPGEECHFSWCSVRLQIPSFPPSQCSLWRRFQIFWWFGLHDIPSPPIQHLP